MIHSLAKAVSGPPKSLRMPRQYAKFSLILSSSSLLFVRFPRKRMSTASPIFRFPVFYPNEANLSVNCVTGQDTVFSFLR
ncbi:unnamed protein product [Protopolystoma xenopodis]|uniref:Uncharacterized protein n=1 Tax=Protopolystoma xenopodis TaxID=117903 RepID=A0A448XH37_9PLAT|nr:unnamed protein product [Protopolystoma xenopodis]